MYRFATDYLMLGLLFGPLLLAYRLWDARRHPRMPPLLWQAIRRKWAVRMLLLDTATWPFGVFAIVFAAANWPLRHWSEKKTRDAFDVIFPKALLGDEKALAHLSAVFSAKITPDFLAKQDREGRRDVMRELYETNIRLYGRP